MSIGAISSRIVAAIVILFIAVIVLFSFNSTTGDGYLLYFVSLILFPLLFILMFLAVFLQKTGRHKNKINPSLLGTEKHSGGWSRWLLIGLLLTLVGAGLLWVVLSSIAFGLV